MNGVINVLKDTGMTSFDVVAKIKKIANEKKVGHTGTLDPEASGVLPVCLGKATKIIEYIMENKKIYRVGFKLGIVTDTYDLEGKIIRQSDTFHISKENIEIAINKFLGSIKQIPPMYSALKQNGVRLYELARKGIEVERKARDVVIYSIENIKIYNMQITMDVCCSKGTYIRSLCYDIGEELGVGATMTSLCRIKNGKFNIDEAVSIEELRNEGITNHIISIEEALNEFDKLIVKSNFTKLLINGVNVFDKRLYIEEPKIEKIYRVYDDTEKFLGLGKRDKNGFKIEKLLIEE